MSCTLHLIAASPMTGRIIITIGSLLWSGLSRPKACSVVRRYKRGRKRGPEAYRHTPHGQPVELAKLGRGGADA
jgi:hypothetical protein